MVNDFDMPTYRGFCIGFVMGAHGYLAAWRSSMEDEWSIGHVYVDTPQEIEKLAHECIDFNYRAEAEEISLGRKLYIDDLKNI
jgi:hypothetical protein